jgi:hypothetical protein
MAYSINRVVRYGGYAVLLVLSFILAQGIGGIVTATSTSAAQEIEIVKEAQRQAAKEWQQQLPIKVDDATTLQNVLSAGATLIYHYRLDFSKSDIDVNDFHNKMSQNLKANVCQNKNMKYIIDYGGSYNYVYLGKDGIVIDDILMNSKSCP